MRLASNSDWVQAPEWMMPILRQRTAEKSAAELSAMFERNRLPFAPISRSDQLFGDIHLNQTGGLAPMTLTDGRTVQTALLPLTLDDERPGIRLHPPRLGEHTTYYSVNKIRPD